MSSRIFISYADGDEPHCQELEKHLRLLQRRGLIEVWHHRRIAAGEHVGNAIDAHIETADLVLLLVSSDFIDSDYCWNKEMTRALARSETREAIVVPILVRDVDWRGAPFGTLTPLPRDGRAIASSDSPDAAWTEVGQAIHDMIEPRSRPPVMPAQRSPGQGRPHRILGAWRMRALIAAVGLGLIGLAVWHDAQWEKVKLNWVPGECVGHTEPGVAYGNCTDLRDLGWLQAQLNALKQAGIRGFSDLPRDCLLQAEDYKGHPNRLLYAGRGGQRFKVGIGYIADTGTKDGCVRLFSDDLRQISATACLDQKDRWWVQDREGERFRRVGAWW